jgi:hypothetical protein
MEINKMTRPKSHVPFTKARNVLKPVGLNMPTPRNIDNAPCQTVDPETFFPDPTDTAGITKAKTLCGSCSQEIKTKCLSFALTNKIYYGIWGGLTELERKSLIRKQYRGGING